MKAFRWFGVTGCALAAMVGGVFVGTGGCIDDCPARSVLSGPWEVVSADPEQPDLVGALVEEVGDTVVITYTRGDGTNWKITYRIDERYEYE